MHRSFKFHAQQSQIGRPKVCARRSKVPRKNRVRRIFSAVSSQGTFCAAHMVKGTWKCFSHQTPRGFGLNSPVHFVVVELGALQLEETKP